MFREDVAGDTEDKYFEDGLRIISPLGIGAGVSERGLTSKTVRIRDQYGALIQSARLGQGVGWWLERERGSGLAT